MLLSWRHFVAITTLSTGLVGVENKGKLILTEIFPSVQNMIFFSVYNTHNNIIFTVHIFNFISNLNPGFPTRTSASGPKLLRSFAAGHCSDYWKAVGSNHCPAMIKTACSLAWIIQSGHS